MLRATLLSGFFVLIVLTAWAQAVGEEGSLHERIDALVEAAAVGPLAPPASDADFLRRVSLDLSGTIPTAAEARAFLTDQSAEKRLQLIDRLLDSPQYARHMALTFDVMLMERRKDEAIKTPEWQDWLRKSFAANKPLDQLFRELLTTDGSDAELRPAARFLLDRECEPNLVTRDIGRIFFGMNLECAQCHDHPLIDDYSQADYYGLFAFVLRTSEFKDAKTKQSLIAEKADGEASFKSVFTKEGADRTIPRLLKGLAMAAEPAFPKGEAYVSVPAKDVRGIPKFSRRAQLAAMLPQSYEFRRNLANRLWAHMFGRGLVHPVDLHHPANPPSNPELLRLLTDELARSNFNTKAFLRELALTRAYQRTCDAPQLSSLQVPLPGEEIAKLESGRPAIVERIDQLKLALEAARSERKTAHEQSDKQRAELVTLVAAVDTAKGAMDKALAEQKTAEAALAKKKEQAAVVTQAAAVAAEAVAKLPDDKVLVEAAAKIAERAQALSAEADAAGKVAAEMAAKSQAATAAHAGAQEAAAKATAAAIPAEQFVALEQKELEGGRSLADTRYQTLALDAQIAAINQLADYQHKSSVDPVAAEAAWAGLVERFSNHGQLGSLRPLTSEQFVMSLMQATGVAEQQYEQQLRGNLKAFADLYATDAASDFQATVNQALFFENGSTVQFWMTPASGNLADRLIKLEDPAALAEELYLAALTRLPTDDEKAEIAAHLKDRADRPVAVGELIWALVSSNEFRFNH